MPVIVLVVVLCSYLLRAGAGDDGKTGFARYRYRVLARQLFEKKCSTDHSSSSVLERTRSR